MSFDAVREHLTDLFNTGFSAAHPGVPIAWENRPFVRPTGAPWVDFRINFGDSHRMDIASTRRFRHEGVIVVQIMVPEDSGTKALNELTHTVFSLLTDRTWSLGDNGKLTTCRADKRSRPNINGYACRSVMVEFYQDAREG